MSEPMILNGQEVRLGWKVVSKRASDGRLVSAIGWGDTLWYGPGRWTVPREHSGPLALFGTREEAKEFAGPIRATYQVHQCWYVPSSAPIRCMWVWQKALYMGWQQNTFVGPIGTILADAVYLIPDE